MAEPRLRAGWLRDPASRAVVGALTAAGRPARFVGGAVRDALLAPGQDGAAEPADLDLATPEPPERVMGLLHDAGIRALPTGLKYGTVTALAGPRRFEITTLRRDVRTFGRHAEVAFTDDFTADAARRDFTINALSCDPHGLLFDPFGGVPDLAAGRVRFVGEAGQRIAEDHLRILRFFRFHARFGRPPADAAALAGCAAGAALVERLSGERVRAELFRLLVAPRAGEALLLMGETGVLARVLPWPADLAAFARLHAFEPEADPLLRLAALARAAVPDLEAVDRLAARLRFANAERERLAGLLFEPLPEAVADLRAHRASIYRLGGAHFADLLRLAVASGRAAPKAAQGPLQLARSWATPSFPVGGDDLIARGVAPGRELGSLLAKLQQDWAAADFAGDRDACLRHLDELLAGRGRGA